MRKQRQVSLVLVPLMMLVVIAGMALVRGNQWGQFVVLLVGLILVDQCRPGRLINHLVVHLCTKSK